MMGILISGMGTICQLKNTSRPESVLRKKKDSVCYCIVHESFVMGESLLGHIPSKENFTDFMTKVLYGQKRKFLVGNIL